MKKDEMDLKQKSRENREKRFKNKLLGGPGLYRQAGQKRRARIASEARSGSALASMARLKLGPAEMPARSHLGINLKLIAKAAGK
ncbi:MAG: hypothetical protein MUO85_03645 [candidate division Zixibacteria bacterium]|nr:hypothetical protein [candidate division Zixibacteria bacterium]